MDNTRIYMDNKTGQMFKETVTVSPINTTLNDLISAHFAEEGLLIPLEPVTGIPAYYYRQSNRHITARKITSLVLNTRASLVDEDAGVIMYPYWASCVTEHFPIEPILWSPPENMYLFFIYDRDSYWMIAYSNRTGNIYKLPAANCYTDGKLCTGPIEVDETKGLLQIEEMFRKWQENKWNTDLRPNLDHAKKMFAYDAETKTQLPVQAEWEELCAEISFPYNNFFNQLIKWGQLPAKEEVTSE